jgi:hypothetical protein
VDESWFHHHILLLPEHLDENFFDSVDHA